MKRLQTLRKIYAAMKRLKLLAAKKRRELQAAKEHRELRAAKKRRELRAEKKHREVPAAKTPREIRETKKRRQNRAAMIRQEIRAPFVVKFLHLPYGRPEKMVFVAHADADWYKGAYSVLSPMGLGLIRRKVGQVVKINIPGGVRRFKILMIRNLDHDSDDLPPRM